MSKFHLAGFVAAAIAATCMQQAAAQAPVGDAAAGHSVAQRWCSNCHLVESRQATAGDAVPTFAAIANKPTTTATSLQAFLQMPHYASRMPDLHLSQVEINSVAAYILTLRRPSS